MSKKEMPELENLDKVNDNEEVSSAEEMFKQATSAKIENKKDDKGEKLIKVVIAGVAVMVALVGVMAVRFRLNKNVGQDGVINEDIVSLEESLKTYDSPVDIPDFARLPYDYYDIDDRDENFVLEEGADEIPAYLKFYDSERKDQAVEWAHYSEIEIVSSALPSVELGYTDNIDELRDEDGNLNPMYSYLLDEHLELAAARAINWIINPVFGGWSEIQSYEMNEGAIPIDKTPDFVSENFIKNHKDGEASINMDLLIDKDGSWSKKYDFKADENYEAKFYGVVNANDVSGDLKYNEDGELENITLKMPVLYKAYAKENGKFHEIETDLTITFVPNYMDEEIDGAEPIHPALKFLVDDFKQVVK